ncbi:MAG: hypothetical protein JSS76_02230 [Bacteroidetes bacterium]|nr:hypothetical protein [Bacteroidota bacterium]
MAKQQPKPASKETAKPKAKQKTAPSGPGFVQFLIAREQWADWGLIGGLLIAILIFLKVYYPYPGYETDSGNYILSAITGKINGYRPYGYSGFLKFFTGISSDVRFVVTWQWFMTAFSVTFFLFTIKYIFRTLPRWTFYLLCVMAILNPSVIYMDSYLMSDSLFVSLTLLFLTTLIWIIYSGSYVALFSNLLLLWWCMDTRYIGLFYPVLSAAAMAWALWRRFRWVAIVGGAIPLLMLFFYYSSAKDQMKEELGVDTFSSFGGWQAANNGVSVLPYVKVDTSLMTDPMTKSIHQIVRQFPDSFFNEDAIIATSFMWTRTYPGKACLAQYIQQTRTPYLQAWAIMGTEMQKYGDFLQSNYRGEYIKHYIIPNFKLIFKAHPIGETDSFRADANLKQLFNTDRDRYGFKKQVFKPLTTIRQVCDTGLWILFFLSVVAGLVMIRRLNLTLEQKLVITALGLFVGAFCAVSTIAAPINNFRYIMPIIYAVQAVPVLILAAIITSRKAAD